MDAVGRATHEVVAEGLKQAIQNNQLQQNQQYLDLTPVYL